MLLLQIDKTPWKIYCNLICGPAIGACSKFAPAMDLDCIFIFSMPT